MDVSVTCGDSAIPLCVRHKERRKFEPATSKPRLQNKPWFPGDCDECIDEWAYNTSQTAPANQVVKGTGVYITSVTHSQTGKIIAGAPPMGGRPPRPGHGHGAACCSRLSDYRALRTLRWADCHQPGRQNAFENWLPPAKLIKFGTTPG